MWSGMCHPRKCGTRICCRLSRVSGYRGSGMSFGQRTDNGWTFSRGCQEGSRRQVRWGSLYRGRYRAYGISCGSMMLVPSTAVSDPPQRRGGLVSRLTQQAALASRHKQLEALASRHKQQAALASRLKQQAALASRLTRQAALASRHKQLEALASRHKQLEALASRLTRQAALASRLTQQAALASRLTRQAALASRHKQLSDSASNGNLCRLICLHFQTRRLPNGTARPSTRAKSPRRHHHRKSADITICMLRVNPAS